MVLLHPASHRRAFSVGQQVEDAMLLEIDQDGPIAHAAPEGEIVYP
jgi:hypothetical protein